MTDRIKIAIAEKEDYIRFSLRDGITKNSDFNFVFDSPGSFDMLESLVSSEVDVLLLSNRLLSFELLSALKIIRAEESLMNLKIIVYSDEIDTHFITNIASLGANSFLSEFADIKDYNDCIEAVSKQNYHFNKFFTFEMLPLKN